MVSSGVVIAGGRFALSRYSSPIERGNLIDPNARNDNHGQVRANQPINILLLGIDARVGVGEPIRADSIIILQIPKEHDRAFLASVPRDLIVEIPANPPVKKYPSHERVNAAFPYGSKDGRDLDAGFRLLSATLTKLIGIKFDAAAIIDFEGFQSVVKALGGVTLCVDTRVESIHIGYDKNGVTRRKQPGDKPVVYEPGCQRMNSWQALDYVRQRHIDEADYARQRHQQQFLKAIFREAASKGVVSDPRKLDAVIRAAGKALKLDDGGIPVDEWLWAMKGIREGDIVMLRTAGRSAFSNPNDLSTYKGEELEPAGRELFDALRDNKLDEFMLAHPEMVNREA